MPGGQDLQKEVTDAIAQQFSCLGDNGHRAPESATSHTIFASTVGLALVEPAGEYFLMNMPDRFQRTIVQGKRRDFGMTSVKLPSCPMLPLDSTSAFIPFSLNGLAKITTPTTLIYLSFQARFSCQCRVSQSVVICSNCFAVKFFAILEAEGGPNDVPYGNFWTHCERNTDAID
ncbi:hypothetical protein D9758_009200 [Tetrapyrgos nigripes]|uniref:Uncharacterized protein n=1 Tax=Tetrapyrgos nigripes TaxID=182062 RepID=A0A8H5D1Z4_9AGAR|nr:hypothetical protein D9758_009200 [Tetrapyrgos nigripes]